MKITLKTKVLLNVLTKINKVVPEKAGFPILENILVTAVDDKIGLCVNDGEQVLIISLSGENCKVEENGITCIHAKTILELVKYIEDDEIAISSNENDNFVTIKWKNGNSTIPNMPTGDFPKVEVSIPDDEAESFDIPSAKLLDALDCVASAIANDPIRPTLCGVLFDAAKDGLTLVATDANRLMIITNPDVSMKEENCFIMNSRAAKLLKNIFTDDSFVTVRFNTRFAVLSTGDITFKAGFVTGRYPVYKSVIPAKNPNELTIDKGRFTETLKRIVSTGGRSNGCVRVKITPDITGAIVEVSAEDLGFKTKSKETIPTEYSGEPLDIAFKATTLLETLAKMPGENVKITLSDARHAALVMPEKEEDGLVRQAVVMPVRM